MPVDYKPQNHKSVEYIIPLIEILAELTGMGTDSKAVKTEFEKVYNIFGNEFNVLRKVSIQKIKESGFSQLAYGIDRMRKQDVTISPGYDGVYGVIKLFETDEDRKKI